MLDIRLTNKDKAENNGKPKSFWNIRVWGNYGDFDPEAYDEDEKKVYEAFKNAHAQLRDDILTRTTFIEHLATTHNISNQGKSLVLQNEKSGNTIVAQSGSIKSQKKLKSYADAMAVAQAMALDPMFHGRKVPINGTQHERAMMASVLKTVNESLPKKQRIKIRNKRLFRLLPIINGPRIELQKIAYNLSQGGKPEFTRNGKFPEAVSQAAHTSSTLPQSNLISEDQLNDFFSKAANHAQTNNNNKITRANVRQFASDLGVRGNGQVLFGELARKLDQKGLATSTGNTIEIKPEVLAGFLAAASGTSSSSGGVVDRVKASLGRAAGLVPPV